MLVYLPITLAMDLMEILKETEKHHAANSSNGSAEKWSFFNERKDLAVSYIVLATVATISGVLGNIMIIGAIFINKVKQFQFCTLGEILSYKPHI